MGNVAFDSEGEKPHSTSKKRHRKQAPQHHRLNNVCQKDSGRCFATNRRFKRSERLFSVLAAKRDGFGRLLLDEASGRPACLYGCRLHGTRRSGRVYEHARRNFLKRGLHGFERRDHAVGNSRNHASTHHHNLETGQLLPS